MNFHHLDTTFETQGEVALFSGVRGSSVYGVGVDIEFIRFNAGIDVSKVSVGRIFLQLKRMVLQKKSSAWSLDDHAQGASFIAKLELRRELLR